MNSNPVQEKLSQSLQQQKLEEAIAVPQNKIQVKGLVGSALSFTIANTFSRLEMPFLVILNDKEEAAYHLNDLEQLLGKEQVLCLAIARQRTGAFLSRKLPQALSNRRNR